MLTAKSLSCRRGQRTVFRDIGFEVKPGGLLLVTGKNGSGKSSLLRVLAGLLPPAEGRISWERSTVRDLEKHHARLHYIGHLDAVKPELTVNEMIRYWCMLYRGKPDANVLDAFDIAALGDRPVRHLSAGQKRRLALTRLVLHKAPLWLLDEPSTSLDDDGHDLLNKTIRQHREDDGIVVLASHHKTNYAGAIHLVMSGAA
jgi:heme exporter protein A